MDMADALVKLETDGAVARITLNRPEALNAFTEDMHHALAEVLDQVEGDVDLRALVLTGAGRGFCAGQDLNERQRKEGDPPPDLGHTIETFYNPLIRRLARFPIPTIAAVNGVAAGAGCSLALACDMVFAAQSSKFILAFAKIGLVPDSGATWMLPRLIGEAKARGFALTAAPITAPEAERMGMIWKCVDDEALMEEVSAQAVQFSKGPTLGLRRIKEVLRASADNDLDRQLDLERDTQRELGRSDDYAEGTAAFLEKRMPEYKGQ